MEQPTIDGVLTWLIIGLTVFTSWQAWQKPRLADRLILWPPAIDRRKEWDRLVTYGFVHADGMHLAFNMITLYSFGRLMEAFFGELLGVMGYPLFYASALVVSILPSYLKHRHDAGYRSLGASGAVSAVLFGFILLQPNAGLYLFFIPIAVPAWLFAALYVGYSMWMDRRGGDNINHSAHLWGAAYGVLFVTLLEPMFLLTFVDRLLAGF